MRLTLKLKMPIDTKDSYFGTYDEEKARIKLEIKLPQVVNKGKKRIVKLNTSSTLLLTKGKGDDIEEHEAKNEEKLEEECQD